MSSEAVKVLDHGFVRFVEAWGHGDAGTPPTYKYGESFSDDTDFECGIIEAARQSTQALFRGWEEDEKLLRTLYVSEPQHATPFEFGGMLVEVSAPTCVLWEWVRHRTHSITDDTLTGEMAFNVMSSRYGEIPYKDYLPSWEDLKRRGEAAEKSRNRQEKGTHSWDEGMAAAWLADMSIFYEECQDMYRQGLESGVPKEIARLCLTFGRYWQFRVKADLRNWLAFMTLRFDPGAQWEIRAYASIVADIIKEKFPRTWALYVEKKSPEHRIKKFTDAELVTEVRKRGLDLEHIH